MSNYKVIQLTNTAVGAVAVDEFLPLGVVTRKIQSGDNSCPTFNVTTTGANLVYLNEPGYYNITYSASLIAGAAGILTITLTSGGTEIYSVSSTATADGTVNVTLPYQVRVYKNCPNTPPTCPMPVQVQLSGVAVTGGTSNLLVEKVY
jgi:hypothetical protein